MSKQQITHLS